jgi:hypothetical protein
LRKKKGDTMSDEPEDKTTETVATEQANAEPPAEQPTAEPERRDLLADATVIKDFDLALRVTEQAVRVVHYASGYLRTHGYEGHGAPIMAQLLGTSAIVLHSLASALENEWSGPKLAQMIVRANKLGTRSCISRPRRRPPTTPICNSAP